MLQKKGWADHSKGWSQLFDFDSDLGIETAVEIIEMWREDDVDFYSSAVKTNESKKFTVSRIGTATLPNAKCVDDVMRTNITFQLEDKSQGKSMTYVPVDGEGITAAGKVKILSADIEETEVGDYVTIHCIFLEECDSISLDVMDLNGNLWQLSDLGGGLGGGRGWKRSHLPEKLSENGPCRRNRNTGI